MSDRYELLNQALAEAFGPVAWEHGQARTFHAGRPIDLRMVPTQRGQPRPLEMAAPFPSTAYDLPIRVGVIPRRGYSYSGTLADVAFDDPHFNNRLRVVGSPSSVVAAALDSDTRRAILAASERRVMPSLTVKNGVATIRRSVPSSAEISAGLGTAITPEELRSDAELLDSLCRRLVGAYERELAARADGAAWHAGNVEAITDEVASRAGRTRRIWSIVTILVLLALGLPIVALLLLL